jgi:hypothetical protein
VTRAYAEYWVAYRIAFDSGERIVASPDQWSDWSVRDGVVTPRRSKDVRYRPFQAMVAASRRHAFVFFRDPYEPLPIRGALAAHGYRRSVVPHFEIWTPKA